jgi:hypothetical protein
MTNLEKMNELVGTNADKNQIGNWAYMNRITVDCLHLEEEFVSMTQSVDNFTDTDFYFHCDDEHEMWDKFLDAEYIE